MKSISGQRAQWIAEDFNTGKEGDLYKFAITGIINSEKANSYHAEIDEMLSRPETMLRKHFDDVKLLKKYFNKFAPQDTKKPLLRDPANITEIEFPNIVYSGEITRFRVTWNEVGIILIRPDEDDLHFSISLEDGKQLAKIILSK
jgi:hypothetical protein